MEVVISWQQFWEMKHFSRRISLSRISFLFPMANFLFSYQRARQLAAKRANLPADESANDPNRKLVKFRGAAIFLEEGERLVAN